MLKKYFLIALFSTVIIASLFALKIQPNISYFIKTEVLNLPPSATISGTTSVCLNTASAPAISFVGSGGNTPYTFIYTINGDAETVTTTGTNSAVNVFANTSVPGTFTYRLISVTDNSGDTETLNNTAVVTVTDLPTVNFSFNNNNTCSGTTVNFTPNVTGVGPFSYAWRFGDGNISSDSNPSHSFDALGCSTSTFNVVLTVTDSNGCSATISEIVTVIDRPDIDFKDADFSNPAQFFNNCSNTSADETFTITVENISTSTCVSGYTIDWGDGNFEPYNTNAISHTYTFSDTFRMQITGTGDNGCISTKTYVVKNATNPQGNIVSPGSTQNLCAPSEIAFTISSNWGANSIDTVYIVDYGDGTTSTFLQEDMITTSFYNSTNPENSSPYPIPHTYTYSNCPSDFEATISIQNSCATTPGNSGGIRILQNADASFEAENNACVNSSIEFLNNSERASAFDCSDFVEFTWNFGDSSPEVTTFDYSSVNHIYSTPGNYTVTLTASNGICDENSFQNSICIEPELVADFTLDDDNGCTPLNVQATNTTDLTDSCGGVTYLWEVFYTSGFCGTGIAQWNFTNGTDENSASPSFEFISAGSYLLQLTTTNTCGSDITTKTVEVKRPPTVLINSISDSCGTASIAPIANIDTCAPPTETVTYLWSFPGGTPTSANTLSPGTITYNTPGLYQVTLTVMSSCGAVSANEEFEIFSVPSVTNTNLAQTICSGTQTSEVVLTSNISGSTFNWTATAPPGVTGYITNGNSDIIPAQTIFNSNTTSEDVTYTVTPFNGTCDGAPVNIIITIDPAPEFTSQPQDETACLNGTITPLTVSVNGPGTPTYQWYSNTVNTTTGTEITGETSTTYTPNNDTVGVMYYYVIASFTSGVGCDEITSNTTRVEVVDNVQINSNPISTQSVCVDGIVNTDLTVTHSGGTGTITYQWYSNTTNANTGGAIIPSATNATYTPPAFSASGNYYFYVVISASGSGCSPISSAVSQVIVSDDPTITTQPLATQELCQSTVPQDLEVNVTGGVGSGYLYQWYSNTNNANTGGTLISGATNATFTPPTANVGTLYYYVIITENEPGCSATSQTSEVIINAAPAFISQPISETICSGNTFNALSVDFANGVGTPTYQWYSNTINDNTTGTTISGETNNTYTPPSATIGTVYYYAVITFSSGGCTEIISDVSEQTVNETPNISNKTVIICSGTAFNIMPDSTGGDIAPIGTTYTWSNPVINPVGTITGASQEAISQTEISQTLTNTTINPSTVTYTVTPMLGSCIGNDFEIVVTVNPSISITSMQTNSNCYLDNGGALNITISGGVPFSTGNPYQINWTGPNGYTNTTEDISNLAPGDYTVSILDNGGCPYNEIFTITEPDELVFSSINFNPETISCFQADDGEIEIDISGGTAPYSYNWTRNGAPFSTDEDLSNLAPGIYIITVEDANNCNTITESFDVIEPPELQASLNTKVDVICFGEATGEIDIDIIGGRPFENTSGVFTYTYSWTGPNGFVSTNRNLTGLFAGTYNVTVSDRSACIDNLEVVIIQTDEIIIDYSATEIECYNDNDGAITINSITGGNAPYTIAWSNLGSGMTQSDLSPSTYVITVTDATNCVKQETVVINSPPIFRITPQVSNVSCFGENDARIILNLEGGIDPVSLVWDDNPTAGVERNNIGPGIYTVTITDSKPCTIIETFTITEPDPLEISGTFTDALDCNDANSGAINAIVTGGTLPLTYQWSNGETTEDLDNIPPGTYTLNIIDANDCETSESFVINRFDPLTLDVEVMTNHDCNTKTIEQSFVAQPSGGVPPYQISWSSGTVSGINNEIMETDINGLVLVDVTDALGCGNSFSYNVDIPVLGDPDFTVSSEVFNNYGFYSIEDPIQFTNISTGSFMSVSWDFGDGSISNDENPAHTYRTVGIYEVIQTVVYPFNCVYTRSITLVIQKGYTLIVPNAFTPNNDNLNEYFLPAQIALSNLKLEIYDTWGAMVYSEEDIDSIEGWDGKVKGDAVENGNYYYTFSGETLYGKKITSKGVFVLIK